jgi:Domain of Unknown Function with PDB structure (DUF3857)/Transglutaminase-like superfamily
MNRTIRRIFTLCLPIVCLVTLVSRAHAQWTAPTDEELKMTSQAEVPGAPAVYLFREEITDDKMHDWSKYARIKVLTERGKEYANVELRQYQARDSGGYTVSDIQGRTIHPDGTIIPFTGKPFEKLIEKGQDYKEMAKVFTLPDVEVGSIIEYRYRLRYDDNRYIAPDWAIQSELFTRKAHYLWKPTGEQLISKDERGEHLTNTIAWAPVLPKGAEITQKRLPPSGLEDGQALLELNMHDVPPAPDEEYMPPIKSFTYQVRFYYSPYRSVEEYWKNEGKGWSKSQDKFIGPGPKVGAAVKDLIAGADTQDQKLRKIYAAVMQLDNTVFTRTRSAAEDKSQGLNVAKTTDDIWERKRGSDDQMAQLFVAMARAAGMKAYIMTVTGRDTNLFNPNYLSFSQLEDDIAIVNVDGKELYFDPGQRYCPYGHLAWKHTLVQGLRQSDSGTAFGGTPSESYKDARTQRVADLTIDEHGEATGTVKITWTGAPALTWRHASLRGDETSLNRELRVAVEHLMPKDMDVKVGSIEHLTDYEQPLTVNYEVKGQIASSTGKRLIIQGDLFQGNSTASFPHQKREIPVYFEYPSMVQDAVRISFPPSLSIESQPVAQELPFAHTAVYSISTKATPTSLTTFRNLLRADIVFPASEYTDFRAFYNKFETKDQEPLVLKAVAPASAGN